MWSRSGPYQSLVLSVSQNGSFLISAGLHWFSWQLHSCVVILATSLIPRIRWLRSLCSPFIVIAQLISLMLRNSNPWSLVLVARRLNGTRVFQLKYSCTSFETQASNCSACFLITGCSRRCAEILGIKS